MGDDLYFNNEKEKKILADRRLPQAICGCGSGYYRHFYR